ncbi:hypothetical protein, partial [Actinomadura logoneensis]|uniref:hypothetical protein n=1 Tax=Actinomadura logoneensis TaxID=2293572 RepID=UPI0011C10F40
MTRRQFVQDDVVPEGEFAHLRRGEAGDGQESRAVRGDDRPGGGQRRDEPGGLRRADDDAGVP